jgi:hypothetical protein
VHTFYEAVGYMISAQPNKPQQERLIAKLMELPNNAVRFSSRIYIYVDQPKLIWPSCGVGFPDGTSGSKHGCSQQHGQHQDPVERPQNQRVGLHVYWQFLPTTDWTNILGYAWALQSG